MHELVRRLFINLNFVADGRKLFSDRARCGLMLTKGGQESTGAKAYLRSAQAVCPLGNRESRVDCAKSIGTLSSFPLPFGFANDPPAVLKSKVR